MVGSMFMAMVGAELLYDHVCEKLREFFNCQEPLPDIERLHPAELVGSFARYKWMPFPTSLLCDLLPLANQVFYLWQSFENWNIYHWTLINSDLKSTTQRGKSMEYFPIRMVFQPIGSQYGLWPMRGEQCRYFTDFFIHSTSITLLLGAIVLIGMKYEL